MKYIFFVQGIHDLSDKFRRDIICHAFFHAFINSVENSYIENYGEDDLFAIFDLYSEKN